MAKRCCQGQKVKCIYYLATGVISRICDLPFPSLVLTSCEGDLAPSNLVGLERIYILSILPSGWPFCLELRLIPCKASESTIIDSGRKTALARSI